MALVVAGLRVYTPTGSTPGSGNVLAVAALVSTYAPVPIVNGAGTGLTPSANLQPSPTLTPEG